jgi:DNA-binding transcriptional LysR family regulator
MPIQQGNAIFASLQLKVVLVGLQSEHRHVKGGAREKAGYHDGMPDLPPPPVDLDLRLVRYFIVVAEHRHFGRAAAALLIAQPSLSRQIRHLEQQLGARLLDRTPQGTQLTEAGEVFLPRAKALVRSAAQAAAATRAAAQPSRITIGYTSGLIITPALRQLRQQQPDAEVHSLHLPWDEPRAALLDHRVDAAVTRLPLRTEGLHVTILYDEPRVLLIPHSHRLAGKESVNLDDIADEPMPRLPDAAWNAYWRIDPRPDGTPAPDGPLVNAVEDKLELIAAGQAVAIVSAGLRAESLHPDLTTISLDGVEPSHVVLAIRAGDRSRLVAAFRKAAHDCLTGPSPSEASALFHILRFSSLDETAIKAMTMVKIGMTLNAARSVVNEVSWPISGGPPT